MEMSLPANLLMQEAERDREMSAYFRELAAEKAAELAPRQAIGACCKAGGVAPVDQPVGYDHREEIAPDLQAALDALVRGERPPEEAPPVSRRTSVEMPREPLTALKMPSTSACSSGSKPVGVAELSTFPVTSVAGIGCSADPLRELTELCRKMLDHKDYARVRADYCRLSIQLNVLGQLAPAYRPKIKTGAPRNDKVHMVLHRDQIVIDLHWIYAKKMPISPSDIAHSSLFEHSDGFPFAHAWALSGKKWRAEYRAEEALCLTTLQQCQMLTLHGSQHVARAKAVFVGARSSSGRSASRMAIAKRLIGQWAERDKRINSQRCYYEHLWLARELLGPGASNSLIAELHALMTGGCVQDRTTIRDKLESLDRRLTME